MYAFLSVYSDSEFNKYITDMCFIYMCACIYIYIYFFFFCFPSSSVVKESACNAGDLDLIPRLGRYPGGGHGNPLHYSCLENPHGQRSLVG